MIDLGIIVAAKTSTHVDCAPTSAKGWAAQGAKPGGRAPIGKVGVTDDQWDSGRPTSEPWERFPVWRYWGDTARHGHHGMD